MTDRPVTVSPVAVRLITENDVEPLTALLTANRAFLAPWDPLRDDAYFTVDSQRELLRIQLHAHDAGTALPCVITVGDQVAGQVNLHNIARRSFQSAVLGYWVDQAHTRRGVATAAVATMIKLAFNAYGLHRLEAGTLVHNIGSQRVLQRNDFTPIGLAPGYLKIQGRWQDHLLFQRLNSELP